MMRVNTDSTGLLAHPLDVDQTQLFRSIAQLERTYPRLKTQNRNYVLHVIGELNKLDIISIKTYNLPLVPPLPPTTT